MIEQTYIKLIDTVLTLLEDKYKKYKLSKKIYALADQKLRKKLYFVAGYDRRVNVTSSKRGDIYNL